MRRAAVIGSPISHSKSPAIFSFLARELGVSDFEYSAEEVLPENLKKFLAEKKSQPSWVGLSVTIPHKEKIIPLLDEVTEDAHMIGAVNTVAIRNQVAHGFNTDVVGIQSTLIQSQIYSELKGKNALILGSGGAARAVAHVLARQGMSEILICNQSEGRAKAFVKDFGEKFPSTHFRAIASLESAQGIVLCLVVNTTPLGMSGVNHAANGKSANEYFSDLSLLSRTKEALAFDLIYNPQETSFISSARTHGFRVVGGLPMLVDQALAAWEIWNDKAQKNVELRDRLLNHLREIFKQEAKERSIFLTGFMGVGKSVVAAALARKLGRSFVDTDRLIEQKAKLAIPEIFSQKGEAHFRELEKETVLKLVSESNRVVALGGGALLETESLNAIKKKGVLVFLEADVEALERRVQRTASSRPLLAGLSPEERITKMNELLKIRMPIYEQADVRVRTDDCSPDEVAELIVRRLQEGIWSQT